MPITIKDLAIELGKNEKETLAYYLDKGDHSLTETAKVAGVTPKAVSGWINRFGFQRRYVPQTKNARNNE